MSHIILHILTSGLHLLRFNYEWILNSSTTLVVVKNERKGRCNGIYITALSWLKKDARDSWERVSFNMTILDAHYLNTSCISSRPHPIAFLILHHRPYDCRMGLFINTYFDMQSPSRCSLISPHRTTNSVSP